MDAQELETSQPANKRKPLPIVQEIYESMRLCRVALDQMPAGSIGTRTPIALRPPRGETYFAVEGSKGEVGVYFISDGSEYPWRAKLRGPSLVNLQILPEVVRGYRMGDVIAIQCIC
jgi:NADH-quinone oxidoreductase subunit D